MTFYRREGRTKEGRKCTLAGNASHLNPHTKAISRSCDLEVKQDLFPPTNLSLSILPKQSINWEPKNIYETMVVILIEITVIV